MYIVTCSVKFDERQLGIKLNPNIKYKNESYPSIIPIVFVTQMKKVMKKIQQIKKNEIHIYYDLRENENENKTESGNENENENNEHERDSDSGNDNEDVDMQSKNSNKRKNESHNSPTVEP